MQQNTIDTTIIKEVRPDGSILMRSTEVLEPTAHRLTGHLAHWAKVRPDKIFLAQPSRKISDEWESLTYSEVFKKVINISQALLNRNLTTQRPVVVLSGNSIEHALIALACLHVGIPFSALGPPTRFGPLGLVRSSPISGFLRQAWVLLIIQGKYGGV